MLYFCIMNHANYINLETITCIYAYAKRKSIRIVYRNMPVYEYKWFKKIKIRDEYYYHEIFNYHGFRCLDIPENKQKIDAYLNEEHIYKENNEFYFFHISISSLIKIISKQNISKP